MRTLMIPPILSCFSRLLFLLTEDLYSIFNDGEIDDSLNFLLVSIIIVFAFRAFLFFHDGDINDWLHFAFFSIIIVFSLTVFIFSFPLWGHWWLLTFSFVFDNYFLRLHSIHFLFRWWRHPHINHCLGFALLLRIVFLLTNHLHFFDDRGIDHSLDLVLFFTLIFLAYKAFIFFSMMGTWVHR